jgi:hypothetical protein
MANLSIDRKSIVAFWILTTVLFFPAPTSSFAEPGDEPRARTLYVDIQKGNDSGNLCQDPTQPCRTLQHAVNQSTSGDTILVAAGVYSYTGVDNPCERYLGGQKAVVCIVNKRLTLRGGYASGNWSTADPAVNLTVIDGQDQVRGVWVQDTAPRVAGITMEGFTIRRGYVQGKARGDDEQTFAFGAGMLADFSQVTLRNMRFENNVALGGNTQNEYGGSAAGAALAIRAAPTRVYLDRLVFVNNRAEGGSGRIRGGYAMGAGLFTLRSEADGSNLEFYDNTARAGSTTGSGRTSDNQTADAFGAVTIMGYADVTLQNVIAQRNRSIGADAPTYAGGAFGGAITVEGFPGTGSATVRIIGCILTDNLAQGGKAANGGMAAGGAIEAIHSTLWIDRCKIFRNTSQGGDGTAAQGPAGGGGVYLQNIQFGGPTAIIKNSLIAYNKVAAGQGPIVGGGGGGGGGIWLQGIEATLLHNTIAANRLLTNPLLGSAILVMNYGVESGPKPADIRYNIIANHKTDPGSAALYVMPDNTATLSYNLFFDNIGNISQSGTVRGMETSILADPMFVGGSEDEDAFKIPANSPAVDRATDSQETVDLEQNPRNGVPDIGAYEAVPFRLTIFPTTSGSIRVQWGAQRGVANYRITVKCPPAASPPDGFACNRPARLNGDVDGVFLTGLANYVIYTVLVEGLDQQGNVILSAEESGFATDLFIYAPLIRR